MKGVAHFSKVSLEEYTNTLHKLYPKHEFDPAEIEMYWNEIILPVRATSGSAGYDFFAPFDFTIAPGCQIAIPTGIRVEILKEDWALFMIPKSRNVKTSIRLSNTVGLIDSDYYYADNEGHIILFLEMPTEPVMHRNSLVSHFSTLLTKYRKPVHYNVGMGIAQGYFTEIGITIDDNPISEQTRTGGFGSTGDYPPKEG